MHYDLVYFDQETCPVESAEKPFTANGVTDVSGTDRKRSGNGGMILNYRQMKHKEIFFN